MLTQNSLIWFLWNFFVKGKNDKKDLQDFILIIFKDVIWYWVFLYLQNHFIVQKRNQDIMELKLRLWDFLWMRRTVLPTTLGWHDIFLLKNHCVHQEIVCKMIECMITINSVWDNHYKIKFCDEDLLYSIPNKDVQFFFFFFIGKGVGVLPSTIRVL